MKPYVLLLILLLFGTISASAQDDGERDTPTPTPITPTPTQAPPTPAPPTATFTSTPEVPDWVTTWAEEMIFPQAVRFTLRIEVPLDQIVALELRINAPAEAEPRTRSVQPARAVLVEARTYTEFEYIWQVPPGNPLPFLAIVDYEWLVVLADNRSATLPGVFQFADPALTWIQDEDPEDRLSLIYPEGQFNADVLRGNVQSVHRLLRDNTGLSPELRLVLTTDDYPFDPCALDGTVTGVLSGVVIDCDDDVIGGILDAINYDLLPLSTLNPGIVQDAILRRMVRDFYDPIWAGRDVPEWFKTGMAYLYFPGEKTYLLDPVRAAARINQLYPWAALEAQDRSNPVLWDAQSYMMVAYMARQIGLPSLFAFANIAGQDGETFADSYEIATGRPLDSLLPNLYNWLFTPAADDDARLRLYQGPTAIPSITNTASPFPPSVTPTFTPTYTLTPTTTPFGFLYTATPLPTLTPTPTATPGEPTITPRPARSFRDLTPTPVPVVNDAPVLDDDTLLTAGIGAAFVLLAILVVILWRRSQ